MHHYRSNGQAVQRKELPAADTGTADFIESCPYTKPGLAIGRAKQKLFS
jgi:uncharacterized protein YbbK (DUF523 family)